MRTAIPSDSLRQWLGAADMSQAELARLLHVDPGQVSRWCSGKSSLRGEYAANIVRLLQDRGINVELPPPNHRVFLATPMASLESEAYEADRSTATPVFEKLSRIADPVYWAAAGISSAERFEAPDLAAERNLLALIESEAFVYLQLRELIHPTSCHIELGIAIALKLPVTVFAPSEESLPYTLRRFEAISGRSGIGGRYRFYAIRSAADAVRLLDVHGPQLLGVARP